MPLYLGLDCGGSSTRALITDEYSNPVFEGKSGSANLASTPIEVIRDHMTEALRGAPSVSHVAGCFAGLLTNSDRHRATMLLEELIHGATCRAYPDYYATLAAADDSDFIAISGTGTLIASRSQGIVTKSSGGGPLIGDEGSTFDLVRRALRRLLLAPTQPHCSPMFWESLVEHFGTESRPEMVAAIYRAPSPAGFVARLAPDVFLEANRGAPFAALSLRETLIALSQAILLHLEQVLPQIENPQGALAGGFWEIDESLPDRLSEVLTELAGPRGSSIRLHKMETPPLYGAVRLAREPWS